MQKFTSTFVARAAFSVAALGAAVSLSSHVAVNAAPVLPAKPITAKAAVAAVKAAPVAVKAAPKLVIKTSPDAVRSALKFQNTKWGGKPVQTLDDKSRILLAQAAAEKAGLAEVGLSFQDVYGVIEAETSWIQRTGSSKDGTPNLGLAQFEPRTAKGLGIENPEDPVQAVFGAALYMKEGAAWAHKKLSPLKLSPEQHAVKVREGVSVYYNLSIKGRNKWDGTNAANLPVETQKHIRNAALGAVEAMQVAKLLSA
jgi:hypothetical protein